ncbi:MAG: oligosaccharide repeat unit polymerase [Erysipelotrichaceae bacterium]|nr:oligosaccharide repeat unit polymerase [Erysipelotrichaceae bacterium]
MIDYIKFNKLVFIDYVLFVIGVILSIFGVRDIAIITVLIGSILLLKIVKDKTGGYINFSMFFCFFHVLYGLSRVISKAWLNQFSRTYGTIFRYCPYILAYSLCTIFMLTGILFASKKYKKDTVIATNSNYDKYFLFVSYVGFALTTIFELINFFRVGGLPTLLAGKAIYQAKVDELVGTLPTLYIFQVSLASYCIHLYIMRMNNLKISLKQIIIPLLLVSPYLAMIIILSRRGPLLAIFLLLMTAYFLVKPLKKISVKLVGILFAVYIVLGLMFAVRNDIKLLFTNYSEFTRKVNINYVIRSLNPALTEFGCTYGNFNKFYITNDYKLLYGKSYIEGLVHIVPTYIYPGEKPRMITYEFRDKYFPIKAEISSIASTGFSSILETYWNFWYFGSIIYFIYGYLIILLENKLKFKNYFYLLEYFSLLTLTYSFHRSDFGHTTAEIIFLTLEVIFIYAFYQIIYSKNKNIDKIMKKIS